MTTTFCERQVNGIPVFGEDCYVVINRMTGKIAAFRKMPVSDIKIKPTVRVLEKGALKIAKAKNAKLYIIPNLGAVWLTDGDAVDALSGKVVSGEIKKLMKEKYATTVDFGKLESEVKSKNARASSKGVDNDQGAVFRAGDWWVKDNTNAAKNSMEKNWDPNVDDFGVVDNTNAVNQILRNYEAVFYSGHGNKEGGGYEKGECIVVKGTGKHPELWYCYHHAVYGLRTRLFVIQACYAANENPNSLANVLARKGVECVIGASGSIHDYDAFGLPTCRTWADVFWDHVTGNSDANYQKRTAHEARIEANSAAWFCDLDREVGNCNMYI